MCKISHFLRIEEARTKHTYLSVCLINSSKLRNKIFHNENQRSK
jgi:hypothetical protein